MGGASGPRTGLNPLPHLFGNIDPDARRFADSRRHALKVTMKTLPEQPNLEHLKSQAKDLLTLVRNLDSEALGRARTCFEPDASFGLTEAQLVIAREYGFPSWLRLREAVLLRRTSSLEDRANQMVVHAVERRLDPALALLTAEPALSEANPAASLVTGTSIEIDPAATLGPLDWPPLLYVCYSALLRSPEHRPGLVALGKKLIAAGADPNASYLDGNEHESCLYGATGVNDCPELARALLEAGARPNDNESLYHSAELKNHDCLKLLIEFGADVTIENGMARKLDFEDREGLGLMLAACRQAGFPGHLIPHALRRGRSAEIIGDLIDAATSLELEVGGVTPLRWAMRLGRRDVVDRLLAAGAKPDHSPLDAALLEIAEGRHDAVSAEALRELDSAENPLLVMLCERGNLVAVEGLLRAGANPNVVDRNGSGPLHQAAWRGHLEIIDALLRHGADPTMRDRIYQGTAIGWACVSSEEGAADEERLVETVKRLLAGGVPKPDRLFGSATIQALLKSS